MIALRVFCVHHTFFGKVIGGSLHLCFESGTPCDMHVAHARNLLAEPGTLGVCRLLQLPIWTREDTWRVSLVAAFW